MSTKDDALIEAMLREYWGVFYPDGDDEQDELEGAVENMTRALAVARKAILEEAARSVEAPIGNNATCFGANAPFYAARIRSLSTQEQTND